MEATNTEQWRNPDPVAAAKELHDDIVRSRDELVEQRTLPLHLVEKMRAGNLFQLGLPRRLGGPQLHPLSAFEAVEALSRADGSVGWCASISSSVSVLAGGWLPTDVAIAMFGHPPDARSAGSVRAEGVARVVPGGYRVTGRWDFASGVKHARWLFCTCVVEDKQEGERASRARRIRTCILPKDAATVIETWDVAGLEGTGSHDFEIDGVFVPEAHTFFLGEPPVDPGPTFNPRFTTTATWTSTAGVSLGIARGALDTFRELASARGSSGSSELLRDRARVQEAFGQAEAILGGARALLVEAVGAAYDVVASGEARGHEVPGATPGAIPGAALGVPDDDRDATGEAIARARLSITHAQHEAVRVVDLLFHAAGTNAVYKQRRLERYFRDAHVAVQHAAGQRAHVETAGKALLGVPVNQAGW